MTSDTTSSPGNEGRPVRVGLFVTCLVDLMRPNVGFASVKLLQDAGCQVEVPELQTCCGQPAYNSGDFTDTQRIAEQDIAAFEEYDYLVAPSGSSYSSKAAMTCSAMRCVSVKSPLLYAG